MIDVNTLAILHKERQDEFVRRAELARLLKAQQESSNAAQPVARMNVWAGFQQMVQAILPTHVRAVRPN